MDLLDLHAYEHPATDTATGETVPKYDRCPVCGSRAYASPYSDRTTTIRRADGAWVTDSSCKCGRYRWHSVYDGRWCL